MHVLSLYRMGDFVLLLLPLLLLFSDTATSLSLEGWALLHFRSNIEEDPNCALSNWNAYDKDPCSWFGVRCENGKVTSINLSGLSLKGTLAPELGHLTNLRELLLRDNDLMGVIPFQLGELEKLEVLDLAYNKLSGHLPEGLGNLSSLNKLYLENNSLEGIIPPELGELRNLYELIVSVNKLRGTIPGGLTSSTASTGFPDGNIPETGVCKLKYLQSADFSSNYFEGDLPTCLHRLPRLSFSLNCLSSEGLLHQRSIDDCSKTSIPIVRRRLLESQVTAGVPVANGTDSNNTNSSPFITSSVPSQAPISPASSPALASPSPSPALASPGLVSSPSPGLVLSPSPALASIPPPGPALGSPSVSSSLVPSTSPLSKGTVILVAVASSLATFLVIVGVIIFLCYRHKGTAVRPWKSSMSGELQKGFAKGVPAFSRTELEAACEDFSNIIGFSPDIVLFKGTLVNGVEIAVTSIRKSAKSWSSNSELIFWRKVESLSQMKHQNLVNLLGYCAEEEPFVRMLVFEYVPNGTVHEHLHNNESEHLDWPTRMRIIMGVAYALDYMHHGFDSPITHTKLDTKSVFLSEDYSSKVADFGVWKASKSQKDSKSSSEGTNVLGHEDLELSDRLTPHLDTNIYDFGVLLLEMVSGRRPYSKEHGSLTEWALNHLNMPGQMGHIVDPTLQSYNSEELEVVGRMAYECLQADSWRILTMRQISSCLGSSLLSVKEPLIPRSSPLLWAELEILSQD